jgi:hypothetical protein
MSKELGGFSDQTLSHWFPMEKGSHAVASRKTRQCRRCGKGRAQPNEDVIWPEA